MLLGEYMDLINHFKWIGVSIDGADEKTVKKMRSSTLSFDYSEDEKWTIPLENIAKINSTNLKRKYFWHRL